MSDEQLNEVNRTLNQIGSAFDRFKTDHNDRLRDTETRIGNLEAERNAGIAAPMQPGRSGIDLGPLLRSKDLRESGPQMGLTIGTDAEGGYTHIAELGPQIIAAVGEAVPLMREVNQVSIGANVHHQVVTTTRSATARAAEDGARSASNTATFARVETTLYDLYAYPQVSNELLYGSQFDLNAWIRQEIVDAFAEALATEFITGDGSSKSVGLLNSMSANTLGGSPDLPWGSVHFETGAGSPESIDHDSLVGLIYSLPARYRAGGNAKFYMSTSAIEEARKLKDSQNMPIWRQDFGVAGAPMVLLGYPVVEVPQLDSQTYRVLFGDMRRTYSFITHRRGVGFIVDDITSVGNRKYYVSWQCAGNVMDSRAVVALRAV